MKMKFLSSVEEVWRFLGMVTYYSHFILGFNTYSQYKYVNSESKSATTSLQEYKIPLE